MLLKKKKKRKAESFICVFYLGLTTDIIPFTGFVSSSSSFPETITSFLALYGSIFQMKVGLDFFQILVLVMPSICDFAK